jgi:hypothetical protein
MCGSWHEAVLRNFTGGTEEDHDYLSRIFRVRAEICNRDKRICNQGAEPPAAEFGNTCNKIP